MKNSTHFPILCQVGLIVLSRPPVAPGGPLGPVCPLCQGQVCRAARLDLYVDSSATPELSSMKLLFCVQREWVAMS